MTIIATILNKKKLYFEFLLFINSEMYENNYVSFNCCKNVEEIILKELKNYEE